MSAATTARLSVDHVHHHRLSDDHIHRHRHSSPPSLTTSTTPSSSSSSKPSKRYPFSSLFLLLFSLRSFYSLLPFLRSTPPSFSLFPFSFLVSLSSFLFTSALYFLLPSDPQKRSPFPTFLRPLASKSLLLAVVFLLRFQALRSCGTATTILVDFSGSLAAGSLFERRSDGGFRKILGFLALGFAVLLQSYSRHFGEKLIPIMLPFLSGFVGYVENSSANWRVLRPLGRKKVRVFTLGLTTLWLFLPAFVSFLLAKDEDAQVSVFSLGWPLVNTVMFGVVLSENNGGQKTMPSSKEVQREFLLTFCCTLVLELFYFPGFSLPGFVLSGFLMWIAVKQLVSSNKDFVELGSLDASSEGSFYSMIRNPICHMLGERKSRKIALFLLINAGYMVVEFVVGFMSNSLGLISDACHMLFDCAALAIGLYASYISRLPANNQFNFGLGRFEVLSGYVNAVFLVLVGALIVLESLERILDPQEISTDSLLIVSIGGFLVNVVGLVFFHEEHHHAHGGGGGSCSHSHSNSHSHHHGHQHFLHNHNHSHENHNHSHENHNHSHDNHHHSHENHNHSHDNHNHSHDNHNHSQENRNHSHDNHNHFHDHQNRSLDHASSTNYHLEDMDKPRSFDRNSQCFSNDGDHNCQDHYTKSIEDKSTHRPSNTCHLHKHDAKHSNEAGIHIQKNANEAENLHYGACSGNLHSHSSIEDTHRKAYEVGGSFNHQEPVNISIMPSGSHSHSFKSTNKDTEEHQKHHHIDHNMEGIFLHVLADTLGSVGVIFSTILIKYKGWLAADPACSIFISLMIIMSVLPLLRNSAEILLQRGPKSHEKDLKIALDDITRIDGVFGIQNVHVWCFTNNEVVGTLNLYVSTGYDTKFIKRQVTQILHQIGIKDLTIQVEYVNNSAG